MMGGGGNSISVPVNLKLEVLQSSLTQLQNLLNKLTPNSKGFKDLQNIVTSITGNMEKLSAQTSKPFINQSQFSQAEKTIENIEEGFSRAQLIANRIEFSDLKLDSSQMAEIENFNQQIEQLRANFESLKETEKVKLLGDVDFSGLKDMMNPNTLTGNFDEVIKQITKKSKELENAYFSAKQNLENLEKSRDLGQAAEKIQGGFMKDGNILPDFEQYFRKLNTSGGIGFKSGQKEAFKEYLIQTFSLDKTEVEELFKKTAAEIQAELSKPDGLLANAVKAGTDAKAKLPEARRKANEAKANADTGQKGLEAAARSQEEVANGADQLNEKTEQVTRGLQGVQQAAVDAAIAEGNLGNSQNQLTNQFAQFRQELASASNGLTKAQSQMNTFNGIKNAVVNFLGFNQVLNITRNAIRNAINHIKELDTTMNGIAIVTNMTTADLWNQVEAYSAMAQNFGVTIQGAYEVSKIYYQAGYDTNEVLTLTNETLKLSKISGLDYATTTDYMMTAMRGFKLEMEDASRVVDVYSNLAANTAVSQQELAEAMTRTASSMESVGATFEETSAMIATMVAVTRESANNIGSAMKSIASRYGELKKDPLSLVDAEGEAMDFNKVDTALKSVGISLKTTDNQFRDFTDVILELAEVWDTLDSAQQRYIATQFAGNRQQSRFLALISNIDLLKENLYNAENSEDVGTLQAIKALDSLESKINQVQVAYQQFYTTVGIEEAWKGLLDWLTRIIENLNNLPKIFGKIPGAAIVVISNLITLIRTLLSKATEILAKTWQMTLQQMKSVSMQEGKEAGQVYTQEFQKQLAKVKANKVANNLSLLSAGLSTVSMMLDQTSETGRKAAAGLMAVAGAAKLAAGAVQIVSGNYVQGFINIISSIAEILSANGIYWETAEEKAQRLKKAAEEASTEAKKIKAETNTLSNSIEKIKTLREERYKSAEAAEEYKETINELADSFPALVQGFDEAGNAIVDITEAEEYLALQRKQSAKAAYEAAKAETDAAWAQVEADQETLSTKEKRFNVGETGNVRERIATLNFTNDSKFDRSAGDEGYLSQLYSLLEDNSSNLVEENLDDVEVKSKYTVAQLQKAVIDYFGIELDPIEEAFLLMGEITEDYNVKNINLAREALQIFQNVEVQDEKIKKQRDDAEAQLKEYLSSSQALQLDTYAARNKTKQEIATYQYDKSYFSSGIENLISTYLFDQVDKQGKLWDRETDFTKEETRVVFNAFDELWTNLDEETQEALKKMISDTYHFSGTDIVKYLQSKNIDTSNIENVLIEPYSKVEKEIEDGIKEAITKNSKANSSLIGKIQLILKNNQVTEYERQLYIQLLELSDVYGQLGLTGPQFKTVLDRIKELPPEMQNQILTNGFNTVEAIENTIKYLESNGYNNLAGDFEKLKTGIIDNLQLTLATATEAFSEGFDTINKEISKMSSGLDISEALDLIKKAKDFENFDLVLNDFTVVNGKLITTQEKAQEYWTAYIENIKSQQSKLEKQLNLAKGLAKNNDMVASEEDYEALVSLMGGPEIAEEYLTWDSRTGQIELKTSVEKFNQKIDEAIEAADNTIMNYSKSVEWASQIITDEDNFRKGIYTEFGDLKELANNTKLGTEGKDARARVAKEKINTAYSNLISDVLSKGFDNINLADYEGLIGQGKGIELQGSYQQFVHDYGDYTGQTVEEINALLLEAIEKDNKLALNDVITKINFYSKDIAYAELSTVKELADQLGIKDFTKLLTGRFNEQGLAELDLGEDGVLAASAEYQDAIAAKATAIFDIIYGSLNNIIKDITSEGMNKNDAGIFLEEIHKLSGLEDVLVEFKNTPTGFKLTEQSVYNIYETLKATGNLQAEILQRDLVGRISKETTIYELDKKIAEIQAKITDETNETNKALKGQLDILKDVRDSKILEEDSSWSFLNDSILGVQNNALKFGDEISKAYGLIDKSIKDSYMGATDFMELVTLFSEKAATTEGGIQFLGKTFTGAAGEIMEVVQELSKVGALVTDATGKGFIVDFKAAAGAFDVGKDALISGVDGYKDAMIDSAVEVIKGQIEFLRPFAELEKLSVEGGVGDFSKFFEVQETGLVEATDDFAKAFLKQSDIVKKFKEQFGENFDLLATFQGFDEKKAQIFVQAALDYKDEATEENLARLFAATKGELDNEVNPVITTTVKTEYDDTVPDLIKKILNGDSEAAGTLSLIISGLDDAKKLQEILDIVSQENIDQAVKTSLESAINSRLNELKAQAEQEKQKALDAANDANNAALKAQDTVDEAVQKLNEAQETLKKADEEVARLEGQLKTLQNQADAQDETAKKQIAEIQAELDTAKEAQDAARQEYASALENIATIVSQSSELQTSTKEGFDSVVTTATENINQALQNALNLVNSSETAAATAIEAATATAIAEFQAFIDTVREAAQEGGGSSGGTTTSSSTSSRKEWGEPIALEVPNSGHDKAKADYDREKLAEEKEKARREAEEEEARRLAAEEEARRIAQEKGQTRANEKSLRLTEEDQKRAAQGYLENQQVELLFGNGKTHSASKGKNWFEIFTDINDYFYDSLNNPKDLGQKATGATLRTTGHFLELVGNVVADPLVTAIFEGIETVAKADELSTAFSPEKTYENVVTGVKDTNAKAVNFVRELNSGIAEAVVDGFEDVVTFVKDIFSSGDKGEEKQPEVSAKEYEALKNLIAETSKQYLVTQENGTTTETTEQLSEAVDAIEISAIQTAEEYAAAMEIVNAFKASMETTSEGVVSETQKEINAIADVARSSDENAAKLRNLANAYQGQARNTNQASADLQGLAKELNIIISSFENLDTALKQIQIPTGTGSAKGNVALAKGTQTLMGELGPELYVTGGRYYVAGQNGAEFVDLPNDAIVFNHLQTQRLLSSGSTGRGKPVTNAKNATAYATGNVTGPAQASASATIQKLEGYLALFESLKNTSAQDLANAGGGGGGDDDKQLKNVTAEIQRWYNLLRQIDKLEKDISYQEQLRAKIESDRVVNGRAMYSTYKEELKYLDQEIARNKELANLQKSWYDNTREELANSAYGKIFTYDENGLQQYVGDSRPGSGLGLDILENLTKMRVTGEAVGAAKNVKTQLDYLKSVGFDIETLKYNNDGTIIDTKKLKGDKLDEAYVQMMQNFWDSVDGWRDKLDGIYDSYHEQLENVISNEEKRNGLLQEIIDNQLSVEQSVYKAIEEREQAAIDRAQEERDALSDSADKFLDGLSEQLDKERNMYDRNQSSEELNKLRRQLAILQRSGGSASQIRELQNQITSQEQDAYFQAQQDQIDAIKEASDAQLERLDHQIDIMTETLEYQKEHGLLWKEVYDVMAGTPEQIQQFIQENTPDFQSNSALQVMEDLRKLKGEIELWISSRDDSDNPIYTDAGHNWSSYVEASQNRYKDILTDELLAQAKAAFDAEYVRSSDPNAAGAAADAILNKKLEEYNRARGIQSDTASSVDGGASSSSGGNKQYWNIRYPDGKNAGKRYSTRKEAEAALAQMQAKANQLYHEKLGSQHVHDKKLWDEWKKLQQSTVFAYSRGGLADYTGLAMVHGSKTRPEAFLNAEQTAMWKNDILGKRNSLTSLLLDFTGALSDLADSNTYNTINRGEAINIDKAEVIMNVGSIANDYDARRAGESALEQMLNIARKTGTRGVSRG